jgi:phosphopantothenoylcysteine decarboxylase/phosphopantothenate--cysteine ligase
MFKDTTVVVGVSGGIAAYKTCDLVRLLVKDGMKVHVVMTKNATRFVSPMTFRALSGNSVGVDIFETEESIGHIALAKAAAVVVLAPATANILAKIARGIADDLLTSMVLATKAPIIFAPAMNTAMWENPATQENVAILRKRGLYMVGPDVGEMACGDYGSGKLADVDDLAEACRIAAATPKDFSGKRFLITSGPTREPIDPVRYISNRSSGKMGAAIARTLVRRGADVTFIYGPSEVIPPFGVRAVSVKTASQMREKALDAWERSDGGVLVAAVADFRPVVYAQDKMKKAQGVPEITLEKTDDILAELGRIKGTRFLAGFAAETSDLLKNAEMKLMTKNVDMIVANDVSREGVGFGSERNSVVIIKRDGSKLEVPLSSKDDVAWAIVDEISGMFNGRGVP